MIEYFFVEEFLTSVSQFLWSALVLFYLNKLTTMLCDYSVVLLCVNTIRGPSNTSEVCIMLKFMTKDLSYNKVMLVVI